MTIIKQLIIIFLLGVIIMSELNPIENTLQVTISDLQARLKALETVRQPYIADWIELPYNTFKFKELVPDSLAQTIDILDPTVLTRLSVGDRLRYKQGGAYKYGVVVLVGVDGIDITGGSDYKATNDPFTEMSFSKYAQPVGYPGYFEINQTDLNLQKTGGGSMTPSTLNTIFRVDGTTVSFLSNWTINVTMPITSIFVDIPYPSAALTSGIFYWSNTPVTIASTPYVSTVYIGNYGLYLEPFDYAWVDNGYLEAYINVQYQLSTLFF